MSTSSFPPRWARGLLGRVLPRAERDLLLSELDELYALRVGTGGRFRALLWYLQQTLSFPWRGLRDRAGRDAEGVIGTTRHTMRRFYMSDLLRDTRHAFRGLRKSPGFSVTVVGTLALGLGAATAVFSVVRGVLLRPLPFDRPDELVMVWEHNIPRDRPTNVVNPGNYLAWRTTNQVFSGMAALSSNNVTWTGDGPPIRLEGIDAEGELFPLLGVRPILGRLYPPEASEPGSAADEVVLSYDAWQSYFGGDSTVVGRRIVLDERSRTIVGVLPASFRLDLPGGVTTFATRGGVFLPLVRNDGWNSHGGGRWLAVMARRKAGVSVLEAQRDMESVAARLSEQFPDNNSGWTANVVPLEDQIVGASRSTIWVLFTAVSLVLLLAAVNVANLLLGRGLGRSREVAIRAALGAHRGELFRLLLVESLLLTSAAALLGLLLAQGAVRFLLTTSGVPLPRLEGVGMDLWVAAYSVALALGTGLLFGILPAVRGSRTVVTDALRVGSASATAGTARVRSALVAAEIALAVLLLVGAGLMIRTMISITSIDPGFDPRGVVSMELSLPGRQYPASERPAFYRRLAGRLEQTPGLDAAGAVSSLPLTGPHAATSIYAQGQPEPARGEAPVADIRVVNGDYFQAMGIPFLAGRPFESEDNAEVERRAIVSQATANLLWPGESALGKVVMISWNGWEPATVVGVVGDVRHHGLAPQPRSMIYWPHAQEPWGTMRVVLRGAADPDVLVARAQEEIWAADPSLPVYDIATLGDVVGGATADRRFTTTLLAGFAGLALIVALLGVYGVMAFSVARRTRELGLRMALGASPGGVIRLVLRQASVITGVGLLLGVGGALLATRLMRSLLYGVDPGDGMTVALVALLMGLVAVSASALPALRASRVSPTVALRAE